MCVRVCVAQVCAFDTPEHLLTEMICQRLAQEYQLVEGVDLQVRPPMCHY